MELHTIGITHNSKIKKKKKTYIYKQFKIKTKIMNNTSLFRNILN